MRYAHALWMPLCFTILGTLLGSSCNPPTSFDAPIRYHVTCEVDGKVLELKSSRVIVYNWGIEVTHKNGTSTQYVHTPCSVVNVR